MWQRTVNPIRRERMFELHVLNKVAGIADEFVGKASHLCVGTCVEGVQAFFLCVCVFLCGSWCVWASRLEKQITSGRGGQMEREGGRGQLCVVHVGAQTSTGTTPEVTNAIC